MYKSGLQAFQIPQLGTILLLCLLALAATWSAGASSTAGATVALDSPASLLLSADTVVLVADGGTAGLVAVVHDRTGRPMAGIPVQFSSTLGSVVPSSGTTTADGTVTTAFTAGAESGQAVVTATAGDLSDRGHLQVTGIQQDVFARILSLEVSIEELEPGQETQLVATLLDATGQPVADEPVTFFGSLGEATPASALTGADGRAGASFQAGSLPGLATVAVVAGYGSASVRVQIQVDSPGTPPTPKPEPETQSVYLPAVVR